MLIENCTTCKYSELSVQIDELNRNICRKAWVSEKIERVSGKTNKLIIVQRTIKKFVTETMKDSVELFKINLYKFMAHAALIRHQYRTTAELKKKISDTDSSVY